MYYVHHVCAGPTEARRTHWNWVVVFHYIEYWELNLGPL